MRIEGVLPKPIDAYFCRSLFAFLPSKRIPGASPVEVYSPRVARANMMFPKDQVSGKVKEIMDCINFCFKGVGKEITTTPFDIKHWYNVHDWFMEDALRTTKMFLHDTLTYDMAWELLHSIDERMRSCADGCAEPVATIDWCLTNLQIVKELLCCSVTLR